MSGGQIVAQTLSESLGLRCVSREDLVSEINAHGELARRVTDSLEHAHLAYEQFSRLRRPYKTLMRRELLTHARQEEMLVYLGYSGSLLLPPVRHFARIRLEASPELRAKMTAERLALNAEEAMDYIRRADEERVRWGRFMYGRDIRDPKLYDLTVSMDRLTVPGVCAILADLTRHPDFQPDAESLTFVQDLWLATEVEAALATDPELRALEVAARAVGGQVVLEGPYLEERELGALLERARAVPGVAGVEFRPGYFPDFEP
jgi:cytidylate kinase